MSKTSDTMIAAYTALGEAIRKLNACIATDICGYCGLPGADKMAQWTGGGVYWPGEYRPETEHVHHACEEAETRRAHAALSQDQRDEVLRGLMT